MLYNEFHGPALPNVKVTVERDWTGAPMCAVVAGVEGLQSDDVAGIVRAA